MNATRKMFEDLFEAMDLPEEDGNELSIRFRNGRFAVDVERKAPSAGVAKEGHER
jgi:hypothetical protein